MRIILVLLSLCACFVVQGCADVPTPKIANLLAADPQADTARVDSETGNEDQLYLSIVDGLMKQGRQGAALAFLDSYAESGAEPTPRYWLLRGDALLALGRDAEASDAFGKLQGTPLAAQGWNGMGRIAAATRDWQTAQDDFRKAVDGDPVDANFLNNLAFVELHLDKARDSAACLQQASQLDPASDRIRNNLIIALTLSGDSGRADAVIAGIKDGGQREATRALVKNVVETFNKDGKP